MRHHRLFLALLFSAAANASVLPCVVASLHSYNASGFSCSEGDLVFNNFRFSESGNAPALADGSVSVDPLADGFDFQAPFTAAAGTSLDVLIGYTITTVDQITLESLSMAGFGVSGGGSVDIAETLCVGAAFAGANCPTFVRSLNVFDNSGGMQASDSVSFLTQPSTLGILKDIAITGGGGSASLSLFDNETVAITPFGAPGGDTPEPKPRLLILCGLAGIAIRVFKRRPKRYGP